MAFSRQDGRRQRTVRNCARPWRARARGVAMAIVLADNLRTHTPAGSKLVRHMLAELDGHLHLVYTPPFDPDAIE